MHPISAQRLLTIVAATFLALWVLANYILRLNGSYYHVFLVAAIACGLMNVIAHPKMSP
ncbi:MAG TPA: hypothetical protein VN709_06240 [Terriglobales bacterium]|nr:hypothetical protein [Terriglobales bacterium]